MVECRSSIKKSRASLKPYQETERPHPRLCVFGLGFLRRQANRVCLALPFSTSSLVSIPFCTFYSQDLLKNVNFQAFINLAVCFSDTSVQLSDRLNMRLLQCCISSGSESNYQTTGHGTEISPWDNQSCKAVISKILHNNVEQGDIIVPPQLPVTSWF